MATETEHIDINPGSFVDSIIVAMIIGIFGGVTEGFTEVFKETTEGAMARTENGGRH